MLGGPLWEKEMGEPIVNGVDLNAEPTNVLDRIKRGLAGYVSYLAACEMNNAFSEYVLYEPMLRILTAREYQVKCEVTCPNIKQPKRGDKKKLDFVVEGKGFTFAIEVKWIRKRKKTAAARTANVETDVLKLFAFKTDPAATRPLRSFLCVFGTEGSIKGLTFKSFKAAKLANVKLADDPVPRFAVFQGKTGYGCSIHELLTIPATP